MVTVTLLCVVLAVLVMAVGVRVAECTKAHLPFFDLLGVMLVALFCLTFAGFAYKASTVERERAAYRDMLIQSGEIYYVEVKQLVWKNTGLPVED
jgi:hypothetical protein